MNFSASKARVTLRDVAKQLKVSHTTVSRALHNDPRISAATRQAVQTAAQEMGHRPDPMLSALAQYRHGKTTKSISAELAWFNAWPDPKQLRQFKEFDNYWHGASEEAERSGFRIGEFIINKQMPVQRVQKILQARNAQGILLPPHPSLTSDWNDFHWDDFCIVRFGHSIAFPRAHVVTSDQLTDGMIAFENIWNQGYRRIGLVTSKKMNTRFGAGYFFSQMKWNPDARLSALIMTQESGAKDSQMLKRWLKANRPDAILTDVKELRDMLAGIGCEVPQDIGLAALSVLDGNADAGIDQNSKEIGKAAVQMLISLINHNERGIPEICRELLIEGRWVDGKTLPPKPGPKRESGVASIH
ncbi:MAG: LacI family DNA-binding transcriptional regulator [Verrucomicrobiota bacterium]